MVTSGDKALQLLKDGNKRFITEELAVKDLSKAKRDELAAGQKPFAIILSCSDSRVPPELIFDQGLGDLFVVRVAGNVNDQITLGSIEYAAEHLKVPLLVVLGHSKCGAIKATVQGGDVPPNIAAIAEKISPAVKVARQNNKEEDAIVEAAATENVKNVIKDAEDNSALLKELIESKKLQVIGAKYDTRSGKVEFFDK